MPEGAEAAPMPPDEGSARSGRTVLLVTGARASGKTTFLRRLERSLGRRFRTCGFVSPATARPHRSGEPAAGYEIAVIGRPGTLPWAARRAGGRGFAFDGESRDRAVEAVRAGLAEGAEVCFLDEIGRLELAGAGFAEVFREALASRCRAVVAAVRKDRLGEAREAFGLGAAAVLDLDGIPPARALRLARRRIAAVDAERIGLFAGVSGLVEVGLGSTLHAWRVPFKGHALAYLQNLLLITFGKSLHGRGLVRISLLAAMLKAFSPMGARFRPMAYIFLQGACFAAPVRLLGWNLAAAAAGSVLMGWLTLGLSLAVDWVTFGQSIFDAFAGAIDAVSGLLGVRAPSLFAVIAAAFVGKGLLSLALAAGAWFLSAEGLVRRLLRRGAGREARPARSGPGPRPRTGGALAALRDLARPRFAVAFLASALLLLFFADLSAAGFASVVVRGLCISWLGFLAVRRLDFLALSRWLDRRTGMDLGRSLPYALGVLGRREQEEPAADVPEADGAAAGDPD